MVEPRTVRRQTVGSGALIPVLMSVLGLLMILTFLFFSTVDVMPPLLAVTLGGLGLGLLIGGTAWWLWRIGNASVSPARRQPRGRI